MNLPISCVLGGVYPWVTLEYDNFYVLKVVTKDNFNLRAVIAFGLEKEKQKKIKIINQTSKSTLALLKFHDSYKISA